MGDAFGEIVFEDVDSLERFLKETFAKKGTDIEPLILGLREGKEVSNFQLGKATIVKAMRDERGRVHLKFDGDELWIAEFAPNDENYVEWLKKKVVALLWVSNAFKTVDLKRSGEDDFLFYSDDEIADLQEKMNRSWMESMEDISKLL